MLRTLLWLYAFIQTYHLRDFLLVFRNENYAVRSLCFFLFSFFTEMKLCSFYLLCKKNLNMVFCFVWRDLLWICFRFLITFYNILYNTMLFDKQLSYHQKVIISVLAGAIWIYFRKLENYRMLPNRSVFSVLFVGFWIYINYYEPLALPIGLLILVLYSNISKHNFSL